MHRVGRAAVAAAATVASLLLGTHWAFALLAIALYVPAIWVPGRLGALAALVAPVPLTLAAGGMDAVALAWIPIGVAAYTPFWTRLGPSIPLGAPAVWAAPLLMWLTAALVYPEVMLRSDVAPRAQVLLLAMVVATAVVASRALQRPRNR